MAGLTAQQRYVLEALAEAGPMDTHELKDDMGVTYDRMHAICRRLFDRALLHRERNYTSVGVGETSASMWYITGRGMEAIGQHAALR